MTITLLLDLDNTLLDTNVEVFLPAYYKELARHLSPLVPPDAMLSALQDGVQQMIANNDPSRTLQQVFDTNFYPKLGVGVEHLRPSIMSFYQSVFPKLGKMTVPRPGARELVDWALSAGHQVGIATDPLFPMEATRERIRWAGLDPEKFDLVSSFESFHFSKSHPAFFAEFLGRLGWPDQPVIMVGNDLEKDLIPAQKLGLLTYHTGAWNNDGGFHLVRQMSSPSNQRSGDLIELQAWLESAELERQAPFKKTPEAILAVLASTPGVLSSVTDGMDQPAWVRESIPGDWAIIELLCHLRDTELEVHHLQITSLLEVANPFVSRPDAAVWAMQRDYLSEDGPDSVREFVAARITTLNRLRSISDEVWSKPARHAIFGPTNFLEVIGFIAEHDRLHLQQAWKILNPLPASAYRI